MKTKRLMVIGSGLALTLALGTGLATAQTTTSGGGQPPAATTTQMGDHDAMHEQMQMPAEQQARCDAHHAQMGNGHGSMMMGGGSGGMGASGGMGMGTMTTG